MTARGNLYLKGLGLSALGMILLSPDALMLRLVADASTLQIIFYRNLFVGFSLFAFLAVMYRGRIRDAWGRLGRGGVVSGFLIAGSNVCFVTAIMLTEVANVLVIIATMPFFSAVLGWLLIREPVLPRTWVTIGAAFTGIAVIFTGAIGVGSWTGDLLAVGAAAFQGLNLVVLRRAGNTDLTPAVCLGGLIGATLVFPFAATVPAAGLAITAHDLGVLSLLGLVQVPLAISLFVSGTRYVPAAEVALMALLETTLGPIWAWLGLGEVPTTAAFIGGGIVILAVIANATLGVLDRRRGRVPPAHRTHA